MKKDTIIIGTRSSKLALWQADYVADCLRKEYPGLRVEKKLVTTKGDKILNAPPLNQRDRKQDLFATIKQQ